MGYLEALKAIKKEVENSSKEVIRTELLLERGDTVVGADNLNDASPRS